jgi:hypothetical protein
MMATEQVPGIPGATISLVDNLPVELPGGEHAGPRIQAKPGQLLVVQPGAGVFLAQDGDRIEFTLDADADPGVVALILNGTARGALIHQRGELPLHAATLVPPGGDRAVAICGQSGAGKSTLAAELSRRGWILVADDTTRVTWNDTHPLAWPSRDSIKLWRDACETAGIDTADLERVMDNMEKFYVRVPALDYPVRLGAIVELSRDGERNCLSAGDKMALVSRNTYRLDHIRPLGVQGAHVRIVSQVASACTVFRFTGDKSLSANELANKFEAAVA